MITVNRDQFGRAGRVLVLLAFPLIATPASAQRQPATIPTVVARAVTFLSPFAGDKPQFFDREVPDTWPAALAPAGVTVLGGMTLGDTTFFRLQTAVFDLSGQRDHDPFLRDLLVRAGYVESHVAQSRREGGFVATAPTEGGGRFCRGSTAAHFGRVDSVPSPAYYVIVLIEGVAGRQACSTESRPRPGSVMPVDVPTLVPPAGAVHVGGGSSWGGDEGTMRSSLRTTLPADSVLTHYATQLVAAGWTIESRPALAEGTAVQRFAFREAGVEWTAALLILESVGRHDIRLELARKP